MVPDFTIPIAYTTDTGRFVECSIDFFNSDLLYVETNTVVEDYLRAQDWTGIGQRVYDLALDRLEANDLETHLITEWPDGTHTAPTPKQRELQAWVLAQHRLINDQIIANAGNQDELQGFGSNTDCTPLELH